MKGKNAPHFYLWYNKSLNLRIMIRHDQADSHHRCTDGFGAGPTWDKYGINMGPSLDNRNHSAEITLALICPSFGSINRASYTRLEFLYESTQ